MTCWSHVGRHALGRAGAVLALVCVATSAAAQAPAAPAQMNMADHRGALQGRVRDAQGAAVADAPVTAVNEENGAQFVATTDAQGAYAFGALPMGKYSVSTASAGLTTFRRRGVEITQDGKAQLDITLDAACGGSRGRRRASGTAAEDRDARAARRRSRNEHRALRAGDARPSRRSLRRCERAGARRRRCPGAKPVDDLPARAHLSASDDQREDRCGARGRGQPQRDGRRGRGGGHAVRQAD